MDRQRKLLLVEDERNLRGLVALFLKASGYKVVEAADGEEAVHRFSDSGPFDVVVLDLNLPNLPGVEVCREVRRMNQPQPVVVCSAAVLPHHEEALKSLGVEHVLTKPFRPESLLHLLDLAMEPGSSAPVRPDYVLQSA